MRQRFIQLCCLLSLLLLFGLLYAWLNRAFGVGIPCLFHAVTGLDCPGCGITRMCFALLRLDFEGAFAANPAALLCLPLFIVLSAVGMVSYIRIGKVKGGPLSNCLAVVMIVVMLLYAVLRNLVKLGWLQM